MPGPDQEEQLRHLVASWRKASDYWLSRIPFSARSETFRICADQLAATLNHPDR